MKRIVLIIVLIFIAYLNSLFGDFVFDDYAVIVDNNFIKSGENITLVFSRKYLSHPAEMVFNTGEYNIGAGEATYRPVATLSYFLNYSLFKLHPWGYRLTNILLHMINAILVYFLLNAMFKNQGLSLFSAILFGIHPMNTEVVNCTAFRPNIFAFLFSLLSIILYFRYKGKFGKQRWVYLTLSLFSFLLAVFSKEISAILPLALIICDIFYTNFEFGKIIRSIKIYILYFFVDIFYLLVYFLIFPPQQKAAQISVSYYSLFYNFMRMFDVIGLYLTDMLFPKDLVPVLSPVPMHYLRIILVAIIVLFSAYIVLRKSKSQKELSFSILWFFIWLLPINNFIYSIRIPIAYRFLYIPILGFSMALSVLLIKIWSRDCSGFLSNMFLLRRFLAFGCLIYFLIFTVSGNVNWRNGLILFSTTCKKYPMSVAAHSGFGVALSRCGNDQEAEREFNTILSLCNDPKLFNPFSFARASIYLARFYSLKGRYTQAEKMYLQALEAFPNSARINTELGILYNQQGLSKKALDYFDKAKDINPEFAPAYINSGMSYILMHKYSDAKGEFLQALEIYPGSKEAKYNLVRLQAICGGLEK